MQSNHMALLKQTAFFNEHTVQCLQSQQFLTDIVRSLKAHGAKIKAQNLQLNPTNDFKLNRK